MGAVTLYCAWATFVVVGGDGGGGRGLCMRRNVTLGLLIFGADRSRTAIELLRVGVGPTACN